MALNIYLCGYNLNSSFNIGGLEECDRAHSKNREKKIHSECLDPGSVCFFITTYKLVYDASYGILRSSKFGARWFLHNRRR